MKKGFWIGLGILVVIVIFSIGSINRIPTLEETVSAQWSQLINQYKRRADLVPQLVQTVQGAADFERGTLESVIHARSKAQSIQITPELLQDQGSLQKFFEAQNDLGKALSRLMVVVERYPDIKVTQNFLTLQSQLEGNENRIAVARRDYIGAVRNFNIMIRTFPGFLWNALFFKKQPLANYTESEEVQKVPDVKFGS